MLNGNFIWSLKHGAVRDKQVRPGGCYPENQMPEGEAEGVLRKKYKLAPACACQNVPCVF